jgi:hypothetical protein
MSYLLDKTGQKECYEDKIYLKMQRVKEESYNLRGVGAANKAAIQLVKVQPYQLLVSDT